jgi:predicted RNA binding protein YcfA (HicA-like mRNA interferase family)
MRPRLPSLRGRTVIAALERGGFYVHHSKGSHHVLRHPAKQKTRDIVPVHRGDLPTGTLRGNIEQAGRSRPRWWCRSCG